MTTIDATTSTVVLDGLHFAEAPTPLPDGALLISDFYAHEVLHVDTETWETRHLAQVPAQPSGSGTLSDGSYLIVSMRDRTLLRRQPDGRLEVHADLRATTDGSANDMLVDDRGRAWVGCFGFDFYAQLEADPDADPLFGPNADPPTATLTLVEPDGRTRIAAEGLRFPNGMVWLSDGSMVVAETVGKALTAFTVAPDGTLTDRRIWADLSTAGPEGGPVLPDGICVDAEDNIWVSDPTHSGAVRVAAGGRVTGRVSTTQPCFAVGLAGPDLRTLVCCTAPSSNPNEVGTQRRGALETATVSVPGPASAGVTH